jgi:hypothetical protein
MQSDLVGDPSPICKRTSGWILPSKRGTFEPLAEFEPGAVEARFLHVTEGDALIDTVAWQPERPRVWWLHHDLVAVLGEDEIDSAWWDERPARMLETPADYSAAHGHGFVVLDWTCSILAILGRVASVECATPALFRRLRETLVEQAMPRGLTITVKSHAG